MMSGALCWLQGHVGAVVLQGVAKGRGPGGMQNFDCIPRKVEDTESERTMFCTSVAEAADGAAATRFMIVIPKPDGGQWR